MPAADRRPFLAWPGWPHLLFCCKIGLAVAAWWLAVYGGADRFTASHGWRLRAHFAPELALPLWPAWAWVYNSALPVFLSAAFVLRRRDSFLALARSLALAIAAAGVCFILFPARLAYPPIPPEARTWMLDLADRVNLDHNLVPSLHVALAWLYAWAYAEEAGRGARLALYAWAAAVSLSTLLTHQHHLVDVLAGAALAWGVRAVLAPK